MLELGKNTWVELDEAEAYMLTRIGAAKIWAEDLPLPDKEAALITAYNILNNCGLFNFPNEASNNMKNAQCEMALFLLMHQEDMDMRQGLQAQGVVSAGIVQENYDKDLMQQVAIPPIVRQMLNAYTFDFNLKAVEAKRDDNEDIQ